MAGLLLGLLGTAHILLGQLSGGRGRITSSSAEAVTTAAQAVSETHSSLSNLTLVSAEVKGVMADHSPIERGSRSHSKQNDIIQSKGFLEEVTEDEKQPIIRDKKDESTKNRIQISEPLETSQATEHVKEKRAKIEQDERKESNTQSSSQKEKGTSETPSNITTASWSQIFFDKIQAVFHNPINTKSWTKHRKLYKRVMKQETAKILRKVKRIYGLNDSSLGSPHQKTQIVIVSGWRSGSSFTYDIIASHPHVFDLFEPLATYMTFYAKKLRSWSSASMAKEYIQNILSCNFTRYVRIRLRARNFILGRSHLYEHCLSPNFGKEVCFEEQYLNSLCHAFPTTLLKFVRLPLNLTSDLLSNPALPNLHVVYLPRDPRAVLNSRWDLTKSGWCTTTDCESSRVLCQDMEHDLSSAKRLQLKHPGRVHVLRYEDLALDPSEKTKELFQDLGLHYHPKVEEFIRNHTSIASTRVEDTYRLPRDIVMKWVQQLKWSAVETVQNDCKTIMDQLGYIPISKADNLTITDIIKSISLPS